MYYLEMEKQQSLRGAIEDTGGVVVSCGMEGIVVSCGMEGIAVSCGAEQVVVLCGTEGIAVFR